MTPDRLQTVSRQLRKRLSETLPPALRIAAPQLPVCFALLSDVLAELEDLCDRVALLEHAEELRNPATTVTAKCLASPTT